MDRRSMGRWARSIACAVIPVALAAGAAPAGMTGKLAGRITATGRKQEPLPGANVVVVGMRLGAATDADGRFTILNIPPGKISVKVSLIGYRVVTTQDV